jgi:transcriptional regulator with XRE-family HTH domain
MEIGNRIKLMRIFFGMTQEDLAGLAGISRPSLVNYEQGAYSPIDDILIRIAKIFGVEPGYLRYGLPIVQNQVWRPSIPKHSQRKQNLIDELKNLLPEFIEENLFSGVVIGTLADGGSSFVFGRDTRYDCILLTNYDLGNIISNLICEIDNKQINSNAFGTIDTFDANCLAFILEEIKGLGLTLDLAKMRNALTRVLAIRTRSITNLDAVSLEQAANHDKFIRNRLITVADAICHEFLGEVTLDQLVAEQKENQYLPTLDVSTYTDPVSKTFCVILKAAYDVLATEQKISRSFPTNP